MTNLLDQNPIYCVEQIVIPDGLPALLKAFAKEAIRHNPKDIETFAWRYFEKLAAAVQLDATAPPPTINQLVAVWTKCKELDFTNTEPMYKILTSCGIAHNTCDNIFKLADFPSDLIDPKEVITLLITATAKTFLAVIRGVFKVFGSNTQERLSVQLFFMIVNFIARRNKDISATTISALHQDLRDRQIKEVRFDDINANPIMADLMKI
ncbi:unnamed protein product [Calypogeia fissa]